MRGIKNENDGKNSLHGIRRNGKTPIILLAVFKTLTVVWL